MKDYFQTPDLIPQNVQDILKTFDEYKDLYHECRRIESELNNIGWTMDWGLDGWPYDLHPLLPPDYKTDQEKHFLDNNETPLFH